METNFSLYHKSLSFPGLFGTSGKLNLNDYNLVFGPRLHYKWSHAHALVGIDAISAVSSMAGVIGAGGIFQVNHRVGVEGGVDYYFTHYTRAQNDIRAVAGIVVTFGSLGGTTEQAIAPSKIDIPRTTTRAAGSGMKVAALSVTARVGTQEGAEILDLAPNGAAALTGLHPGDVINSVNGKIIKTPMELVAELSNHGAGDKVRIGYMLHGEWQTETMILLP